MSNAARLLAFAFAAADLLVEVKPDGKIAFASGAAESLFGVADSALAGRAALDLFEPEDRPFVRRLFADLKPGRRFGPVQVTLAGADGAGRITAMLSGCLLPENAGHVSLTIARAIGAAARAAEAARRDAETHLLAPEPFADLVGQIAGSGEARSAEVALFEFAELDALRSQLAPAEAGALLERIGATLRAHSVDGVAAGRVSDNRFGVVHAKGRDRGVISSELDQLARDSGASGGLGITAQGLELDQVVPADAALRAVRYVLNRFAEEGIRETGALSLSRAFETMVADTVGRIDAFLKAVREDAFALAYQPVVDLKSRQVIYYEVLARFADGESPFRTIQFAEALGLIERFDLAVAMRAADELARGPKTLALAVNVSGRSIGNAVFVRCLTQFLASRKVLAGRLSIEITESAEIADLPAANTALQAIRALGFKVALDDFGAGAASFRYLHALGVDIVKLDGTFVKRLGTDEREDAMVRAVVRMCADLKTACVAEWVETEEQAGRAQAMGFRYGQGRLYGEPRPRPEPPLAAAASRARRMGERESWG